jgi:hypothetical protein
MGRISTGVSSLDACLRGGLPSGIVEISGGDASGKTTLGLSILREAYLRGHTTGIVHLEGLPDKEYIGKVGPAATAVSVPVYGEEAMELVYQLVLKGAKAVLIDTITSVEPRDYNPDFWQRDIASRRRLLYHSLTHIRKLAYKRRCSVVCLNQIRCDLFTYGLKPPMNSLFEDLSDLRLSLTRRSYETEYGSLSKVLVGYKINKSLLSGNKKKGSFLLWPEVGVDRNYELLAYLLDIGKLKRSGAYFTSKHGHSLGPGYMTASEQIGEAHNYYKEDL